MIILLTLFSVEDITQDQTNGKDARGKISGRGYGASCPLKAYHPHSTLIFTNFRSPPDLIVQEFLSPIFSLSFFPETQRMDWEVSIL